MPIIEYYVDPALNISGGSGTIGSPYGDLQYALDQINHSGNGARINIKAGTDEILSSGLSYTNYLATNGAGSSTEPLILQGYTSSPGDGGIGVINGLVNSVGIWTGVDGQTADYVMFKHLNLLGGNNAGYAINIDNNFTMTECEFSTRMHGIDFDHGLIERCKIYYVGQAISTFVGGSTVDNCIFIATGGGALGICCSAGIITNNIINVLGVTEGNAGVIGTSSTTSTTIIKNNIILANITGGIFNNYGITVASPNSVVENNYIKGFGGTNGRAINITNASFGSVFSNNKFFNNTNNYINSGLMTVINGDTGNLSADAVPNAVNGDYTPTSDLIGAGWPNSYWATTGTTSYPSVGAIYSNSAVGSSVINIIDPLTHTIPGI